MKIDEHLRVLLVYVVNPHSHSPPTFTTPELSFPNILDFKMMLAILCVEC